MRSTLAVAAILALTPAGACSRDIRGELQGKWLGDKVTNLSPELAAEATAWVKGVSLEFRNEQLIVSIPGEQPRAAPYEVDRVDGTKITIRVLRENMAPESTTLLLAKNEGLQLDIGQGRSMLLTKTP